MRSTVGNSLIFAVGLAAIQRVFACACEVGQRLLLVRLIEHLHVNQRLGSGEALSLRNHDLHFVLSSRFGVEHPAIRRGEDQLVGRAKLLLRGAVVHNFEHFRLCRGADD